MQLPEILFGNSSLQLKHKPTGRVLQFTALEALRSWVDIFKRGECEVKPCSQIARICTAFELSAVALMYCRNFVTAVHARYGARSH
jgi:hypothetical protein